MEVDVSGIFKMSLKAYQLAHLIYYMNNICKVSEAVEKYLITAVIDKWAHSHFDERYDNIVNVNITEYKNRILKSK